MDYGDVNSLIKLDTGLQVSAIVGLLCYIILRSGLTKKDDSMIVLLISSIIGLITNLIWSQCLDIWLKIIFAIVIPILIAVTIRFFELTRWFLEKIFRCTQYGDNIYLLKNINNKVTSITLFLKSGEILIASAEYNETLIKELKKKPYHIDNDKSFFIAIIASLKSKDHYYDIPNHNNHIFPSQEIGSNHVKFRYVYGDAIESFEIEYQKN